MLTPLDLALRITLLHRRRHELGHVGERIDGYLGIVKGGADPSLVRLVQDINNRRRAAYGETAEKTGTTPQQVARVTGERLIAQAAPGEYIMDDSGTWSQK